LIDIVNPPIVVRQQAANCLECLITDVYSLAASDQSFKAPLAILATLITLETSLINPKSNV